MEETEYRGFIIANDYDGEYTVIVDFDDPDFHEEKGSMMGGFHNVEDAMEFIDRELTGETSCRKCGTPFRKLYHGDCFGEG